MNTINNLPGWIRWLLILPGTVISNIAIYALSVGLTNYYIMPDPDSMTAYIIMIMSRAVATPLSIFVGVTLAPMKKRAVAIVLTCIYVILAACGITLYIASPSGYVYSVPGWQIIADGLITIVTSVYVCVNMTENETADVQEHGIENDNSQ